MTKSRLDVDDTSSTHTAYERVLDRCERTLASMLRLDQDVRGAAGGRAVTDQPNVHGASASAPVLLPHHQAHSGHLQAHSGHLERMRRTNDEDPPRRRIALDPPPPRGSTRICNHVRATPPAYAGI